MHSSGIPQFHLSDREDLVFHSLNHPDTYFENNILYLEQYTNKLCCKFGSDFEIEIFKFSNKVVFFVGYQIDVSEEFDDDLCLRETFI